MAIIKNSLNFNGVVKCTGPITKEGNIQKTELGFIIKYKKPRKQYYSNELIRFENVIFVEYDKDGNGVISYTSENDIHTFEAQNVIKSKNIPNFIEADTGNSTIFVHENFVSLSRDDVEKKETTKKEKKVTKKK